MHIVGNLPGAPTERIESIIPFDWNISLERCTIYVGFDYTRRLISFLESAIILELYIETKECLLRIELNCIQYSSYFIRIIQLFCHWHLTPHTSSMQFGFRKVEIIAPIIELKLHSLYALACIFESKSRLAWSTDNNRIIVRWCQAMLIFPNFCWCSNTKFRNKCI